MKTDILMGRLILAADELLENAVMDPETRKFQVDSDVYEELRLALEAFRGDRDDP